jgi:hypothetical protein
MVIDEGAPVTVTTTGAPAAVSSPAAPGRLKSDPLGSARVVASSVDEERFGKDGGWLSLMV